MNARAAALGLAACGESEPARGADSPSEAAVQLIRAHGDAHAIARLMCPQKKYFAVSSDDMVHKARVVAVRRHGSEWRVEVTDESLVPQVVRVVEVKGRYYTC